MRQDANTSSKWDSITSTVFWSIYETLIHNVLVISAEEKALRVMDVWMLKGKRQQMFASDRGWKDKKTQFAHFPWRAQSLVLSTSPEPLFSRNSLHISPFSIWWQTRGGSTRNCSKLLWIHKFHWAQTGEKLSHVWHDFPWQQDTEVGKRKYRK